MADKKVAVPTTDNKQGQQSCVTLKIPNYILVLVQANCCTGVYSYKLTFWGSFLEVKTGISLGIKQPYVEREN